MASRALKDIEETSDVATAVSGNGYVGPYVDEVVRLDAALWEMQTYSQTQAWAQMQPFFMDWDAWRQMWEGTYVPDGAEGPFSELYLAKIASKIDRLTASILSSAIPDRSSLDYFDGMAEPVTGQIDPDPNLANYAVMQAAAIRHFQKASGLPEIACMNLTDCGVTGNCFQMKCWEEEVRMRLLPIPNPIYAMDDTKLAKMGMMRVGQAVVRFDPAAKDWRVVPAFKTNPQAIREPGLPKTVYLDPRNVGPTELDRNGLESCSGVWIYDDAHAPDLAADCVMPDGMGGLIGNYANITRKLLDEASTNIPSIRGRNRGWMRNDGDTSHILEIPPQAVKRLARNTYYGWVDVDEVCKEGDVDRGSPGYLAWLAKYNADPDRVECQQCFVSEYVGNSSYDVGDLVRFQPLPYNCDKKPAIHHRFIPVPGRTLGMGLYSRGELPERISNSFTRSALNNGQLLSNPPVAVYEELVDPAQVVELGGITELPPGILLKALSPQQGPPIVPIKMPSDGLEFSQKMADAMSIVLDEMVGVSAAVSGTVSGSATAREVSIASAATDSLIGQAAIRFSGFLIHGVDYDAELCRQYMDSPRTFMLPGETGQYTPVMIPLEAWQTKMFWTASGPGSVAGRQNQLQYLNDFAKAAKDENRLNFEEYADRFGRAMQIPNPRAMIAPPPQEEPVPRRDTISIVVPVDKVPASIGAKCLAAGQIDLTPQEVAEWANNNVALGAAEAGTTTPALPPPRGPQGAPQPQSPPSDAGQPGQPTPPPQPTEYAPSQLTPTGLTQLNNGVPQ